MNILRRNTVLFTQYIVKNGLFQDHSKLTDVQLIYFALAYIITRRTDNSGMKAASFDFQTSV